MRRLKKLKTIKIQESIQDEIKRYIIENKIPPGERLPSESYLAEALGVSRSSIREALRALESIGILDSQQGSGWYVKSFNFDVFANNLAYSLQFDSDSIYDLLEIRKVLEENFLREAINSLSEKDIKDLEKIIKNMENYKDKKSLIKDDMQFHKILYRNIKNKTVIKILSIFWNIFENLDEPLLYSDNPEISIHYHKLLLNSIKSKNYDESSLILKEHFKDVHRRLSQFFKERR